MENRFHLKENHTSVSTELMAGLATFMAMAYIVFVAPSMIADAVGAGAGEEAAQQAANGAFVATCLSAFIGTGLMAFLANLPLAQAVGVGSCGFFAYTIILKSGYSYPAALALVFLSGLFFIICTVTGLREKINSALPKTIKAAISAGLGIFIAFIGLQNAGIIVPDASTGVTLAAFSQFSSSESVRSAVLAIIGILLLTILWRKGVRGAILYSILILSVLAIPFGVGEFPSKESFIGLGTVFSDFKEVSFLAFSRGFKELFRDASASVASLFSVIVLSFTFFLSDLFNTLGTLIGATAGTPFVREDGSIKNMNRAMLCDAVATTAGAMLGAPTVTTFAEAGVGIRQGGRTGLSALVTALLFLLILLAAPVAKLIPYAATAPALIFVGVLMTAGSIHDMDFSDMTNAVPAFLTLILIPLSYNIATGIAFGMISYVVVKACMGRWREISPYLVVFSILFFISYALV
jgi:AGZA family xanthine/uracil permease-like MFS transporter